MLVQVTFRHLKGIESGNVATGIPQRKIRDRESGRYLKEVEKNVNKKIIIQYIR